MVGKSFGGVLFVQKESWLWKGYIYYACSSSLRMNLAQHVQPTWHLLSAIKVLSSSMVGVICHYCQTCSKEGLPLAVSEPGIGLCRSLSSSTYACARHMTSQGTCPRQTIPHDKRERGQGMRREMYGKERVINAELRSWYRIIISLLIHPMPVCPQQTPGRAY